jgi:4-oxalocrotonate tautomerase
MPEITMKIGKIPVEKKKELIQKLTQTAVEVTSIPASKYMVFIEEYDRENIGVGGVQLSPK